jgi:hypothetical protein
MKKGEKLFCLVGIFFLSCLFMFTPPRARADGIAVGEQGILSEPGQKAVIIWDEDLERQTLILHTSFSGLHSISDFCWIIPIQSSEEPDVKAASKEVFEHMEGLFPQIYRTQKNSFGDSYTWSGSAGSTVEVLATREIEVYDITTLWASDPDDLTDWLTSNGYDDLPSDFSSTVEDYTDEDEGCYFVLNRIDLSNEFATPLDYLNDISPSTFTLLTDDSDSTNLSLSNLDDEVDDLKNDIVGIIKNDTPTPYNPNSFIGYIMTQAEYNYLMNGYASENISLSTLRTKVKDHILSSDLFSTVYDLLEGAGTPLEITFYPDKPTYPLYISSLDDTYGGIDVYFIGPEEVEDKNQILRYWGSIALPSKTEDWLEDHDIDVPDDCYYITLLLYRGYLDEIEKDSVFIEYRQSHGYPSTWPPYYPPSSSYYPSYFPSHFYSYSPYPSYTPYTSSLYPTSYNWNIPYSWSSPYGWTSPISLSPSSWPGIQVNFNVPYSSFGGLFGGGTFGSGHYSGFLGGGTYFNNFTPGSYFNPYQGYSGFLTGGGYWW